MSIKDLAKLMGKTPEQVEEMFKSRDTIEINLNERE